MKDAEKSSTDLPQKMDYVGKPWKVKLQALEASQAHDFQVFLHVTILIFIASTQHFDKINSSF
jgi:hypothetical protein